MVSLTEREKGGVLAHSEARQSVKDGDSPT